MKNFTFLLLRAILSALLPLFTGALSVASIVPNAALASGGRSEGVNIIVQIPAAADRAYNLSSDHLGEAAKQAARAEGWEIDPNSKYFVRVGVEPVSQRDVDLYAFRINVEGGPIEPARGRARVSAVTAARVVDVPLRDHSKLREAIDELVRGIAYKLRARTQPRDHH
ncbi:MAG: hypothetical protein AUI33_02320 [Ignavibacteria bacterium 13_1_40CM_2_61_4]|nr:MAG: hypothetical protein AUI33_02320 [Ignavibacteria bacterium 13_1_40CM_2_61_4]